MFLLALSPAWWPVAARAANPSTTSDTPATPDTSAASEMESPLSVSASGNDQISPSATSIGPAALAPPVNSALPTISGTAQPGMQLTAWQGSWTETPTSFKYKWRRCNSRGAKCVLISGASSSTYVLGSADVGSTLRVVVTAYNAAGHSRPAVSAPSAVVSDPSETQHLEYVFEDGLISVYDMDHSQQLLKTISLPQTESGIRGVTVAPSTHRLFISYGGDGTNFNGSVLAYDLVSEKVLWTVHLNTGIDSGEVSPDGKRLYMPTGENTASGIWNILDTQNGALIGTIQGGSGAHNTIASSDGRYVYLGGRDYNYLDVYDTSTGKVRGIGPLVNGVRPFTVNGSNTLAFTTATEVDGFQVSSITTGKVLFTVSFGAVPKGFPFTGPSHGASLSPDEKQLYVIDSPNKEVHVYDVSRVAEGIAPSQLGVIPVAGLSGNESKCAYDCGRGGWLQHSIDGRFVYVGDSGAVIDTATRKVLTSLPTLLNTKKTLEIDWAGGVPVATSGRTGVGHVG
jgi:WD40 repeat protein